MAELIKAFECHGVELTGTAGDQMIGVCPFCFKEGHFYVHRVKGLWDCKRCGKKGNLNGFLEEIGKRNERGFSESARTKLSSDRRLPATAFTNWGIGWDGAHYTIPVKDSFSRCVDLRIYKPGSKLRATSGASLGLLGAERLVGGQNIPLYVCEGEWDGIALEWLRTKLGKQVSIVAVPGASVFKNTWKSLFSGRDVILLYDNDSAGATGRDLITSKLQGLVRSIKSVDWPSGLPTGFDVRDFVVEGALRRKTPRACWEALNKLCTPFGIRPSGESEVSQHQLAGSETPSPKGPGLAPEVFPPEIVEVYRKWLHLPSDEVLRVMFGAVYANKLQGDPIWLFLVAPPGGSKSELLSSLSRSPLVESTTSLTPHSLVSGAHNFNGQDPSLLPKLNGRILVIKDFTTILSMHYSSRDEIFGVLRDAYDGRTEKTFGTGLKRSYVSHFGIIAGVTSAIEAFGTVHQSLGERFLKYRVDTGQKTLSEADRIRRALGNINRETQMRDELCQIATKVIAQNLPEPLPTIPPVIFEYIVNLAQTCAMMRGVVARDRWSGQVAYKPSIEVGTRLAKQLAKMSMGIAMYLKQKEVDFGIYRTVRKLALDTAPDRIEEVVKQIWFKTEGNKDAALKTNEISMATRLPTPTCFRILQDLELLKLVDRIGKDNKYEWRLNSKLEQLIKEGRVYERRS